MDLYFKKQFKQTDNDDCWREAMVDALTVAVEGLNARFKKPKELSIYIDIGTDY